MTPKWQQLEDRIIDRIDQSTTPTYNIRSWRPNKPLAQKKETSDCEDLD